jgi:4-hydroxybenzoate polyprenyltransferase
MNLGCEQLISESCVIPRASYGQQFEIGLIFEQTFALIRNYLSLIKFSHTVFALPFAAIGFLAGVADSTDGEYVRLAILILLCMVFARSAAMAFNRWADREIDSKNLRTAVREIPAGVISAGNVLVFTVIMSLLFILTTWFINTICFILSPVALFVVLGYSYTKRFTPYSHLVLGVGLSLAPVGAYLAVTGHFSVVPVLFSLAVVTWVAGFDIIYSLQDESFDKQHNLFSIPARFGRSGALRVSVILHVLTSVFLLLAFYTGDYGVFSFIAWGGFTALLVYQHMIVKPDDLSRVNIAFFTTNGIASVMLAVLVFLDFYL